MNPMLSAALGSVLRWALMGGAAWLVERGVWTQAEATTYVTGAALALLSLGWSLWDKYRGRLKLLTALTMAPGVTEHELEQRVDVGVGLPSVATPKHEQP